jgi:hypothetical protein
MRSNNIIEDRKQYLNRYKLLCSKLASLREQEETLRIELVNVKAINYTGMPKGNKHYDLSDCIVRLEELYSKIAAKQKEQLMLKVQIEDKVSEMNDGIECDLLRKRYIEFKSWEQICDEIGYSLKQTYRIHNKALEDFSYDIV